MISQGRFHVHIGKTKYRCRTLLNGVLQGSVIAPALFNLYTFTFYIPDTISSKYIYADDIVLLKSDTDFPDIEAALSNDLDNLRGYFFQWRLKLNITKTICGAFHLSNRKANYELKNRKANYELNVTISSERRPFHKTLKYLGVTLDRTLYYKKYLTNTAEKP